MRVGALPPQREDRAEPLAVVTGASHGLGRALSIAFSRRGVRVVGLARGGNALMETGQLCGSARFSSFVADVADTSRTREVFAEIEGRIGPVTILFNNAAIYPRVDFLSAPPERVLEQVAVNLNGYINCTSATLSYMGARGYGRIVNVGTFAGEMPIPGSLGYSVSKAGVRVLTRAVAVETRDRLPGIVVSEWIPGILSTGMGMPSGIAPELAAEWGVSLALSTEPELHGATFLEDREVIETRGLLRRLKDRALGVPRRRARRL